MARAAGLGMSVALGGSLAILAALVGAIVSGREGALLGGVTALLAGMAAAALQRRSIQRSIRRAEQRLASWPQDSPRWEPPSWPSMSRLVESFVARLRESEQDRQRLRRETTEQAAVLASMTEAVIAVDARALVLSLNSAAAALLGTTSDQARGRHIQEVVRNTDLCRFVSRTLTSQSRIEGEIVIGSMLDRVLQAHGTPLETAPGEEPGAVIVLNDVTRLRRLENLRREFVANVSHELKTPITSIKGFVETLLDGALQNERDAVRFLRIIAQQTDRLSTIIDDLLCLSRIEQGEGAREIPLELSEIDPVLRAAIRQCHLKAQERAVRIELTPGGCRGRINATLLEQAVVNLLDNAVKHSPQGSSVLVTSGNKNREIVIEVADQGCGIPAEHLPRIFERFYRVDKGRSRQLGGTGLGLSIVKHIVKAHHGRVDVDSTPGCGTRFSIHIPAPQG